MSARAEGSAAAGAPIWTASPNSVSPPRFRPKLKSSLPRVLLQDNRSLSGSLDRTLASLIRAKARVETRWDSNKRKLVAALATRRDKRRRSTELFYAGICETPPARGPGRLCDRQPPDADRRESDAAPPAPYGDAAASAWALPPIHGAGRAQRKDSRDGGVSSHYDGRAAGEEPQLSPTLQRRLSLGSGRRVPAALSRNVSVAPAVPGRFQYDVIHQIEEEDRLVAFLTFRTRQKGGAGGRSYL